jgi:hypothetical protein
LGQDVDRFLSERRAAFLPARAFTAEVGADPEDDVPAPEADEF